MSKVFEAVPFSELPKKKGWYSIFNSDDLESVGRILFDGVSFGTFHGHTIPEDHFYLRRVTSPPPGMKPVPPHRAALNNMRKVLFSRWMKPSETESGMREKLANIPGFFHAWGTVAVQDETCLVPATIGIIESEDGRVHEVNPSDIKFVP